MLKIVLKNDKQFEVETTIDAMVDLIKYGDSGSYVTTPTGTYIFIREIAYFYPLEKK